jgi:hypothetical protein
MIRETYKGRKLKVVKGRGADYGYSSATLNGVDLGKHMGDEAAAIQWMKGTIDHADEVGMGEGRYGGEWYAPGTFELNEHGHVVAPGGICSCGYCEERRIQPCANIKVDGKCVCDHCMKPYFAEKPAPVETPAEEAPSEATDGDVLAAFEAKADEISKANGWTIARTENVMLRYLRDTSPAEAATIAAALQTRRDLAA